MDEKGRRDYANLGDRAAMVSWKMRDGPISAILLSGSQSWGSVTQCRAIRQQFLYFRHTLGADEYRQLVSAL